MRTPKELTKLTKSPEKRRAQMNTDELSSQEVHDEWIRSMRLADQIIAAAGTELDAAYSGALTAAPTLRDLSASSFRTKSGRLVAWLPSRNVDLIRDADDAAALR
jgi:hypothetical protein